MAGPQGPTGGPPGAAAGRPAPPYWANALPAAPAQNYGAAPPIAAMPPAPGQSYPAYPPPYGAAYNPSYGAPYGAAYPPAYPAAYPAPYYLPPPGKDTFAGLKWMKYGVGLMIVFNIFALIANLLIYAAFGQLQSGITNLSLQSLQGALTTFNIAAGVAVLAVIFALIGMILGLVGIGFLSKGKAEFGPHHARSVSRGVALAVATCMLYLLYFMINLTTNTSVAGAMETADINDFPAAINSMFQGLILASVVSLIAAMAASFSMTSLVNEIMTREGTRARGVFLALSMAGPLMVLIAALMVPGMINEVTINTSSPQATLATINGLMGPLKWLALVPALENFLALLSLGLYNKMLDTGANGARNMIASGVFHPDMPVIPTGKSDYTVPLAPAYGPQPPQ